MRVKNDFSFTAFLGSTGEAVISGAELSKKFAEDSNLFLMDYGNAEVAFTGQITAHLMGREEIHKALEAYEMYSPSMPYPEGYKDRLLRALEVTPEVEDPVQITVEQLPE